MLFRTSHARLKSELLVSEVRASPHAETVSLWDDRPIPTHQQGHMQAREEDDIMSYRPDASFFSIIGHVQACLLLTINPDASRPSR